MRACAIQGRVGKGTALRVAISKLNETRQIRAFRIAKLTHIDLFIESAKKDTSIISTALSMQEISNNTNKP